MLLYGYTFNFIFVHILNMMFSLLSICSSRQELAQDLDPSQNILNPERRFLPIITVKMGTEQHNA
jgi:hypothetical protein